MATTGEHKSVPQKHMGYVKTIYPAILAVKCLAKDTQGKTRLSKWYQPFADDEKEQLCLEIHRLIVARDNRYANFLEFRNYTLVYRRYQGLYFCMALDINDNELAYLEAIHLLVEVLDKFFENVCELDLVYNFHKVYAILDEIILGGELQETSKPVILHRLQQLYSMD